ncbi:hypothetical protein [Streptodolium elevatio]|uniref:Uncharacterized protein n=1 Tax=Streptodolium elevatio TaxID=3157996 RepID=A0ABV3DBZ5_9ACTN
MPTADQIKKYVNDERVQDIVDIAAEGGITYWAITPNDAEFAGLPEGKTWTIVEGIEPHPLYPPFNEGREVEAVHYLNADDIRQAYAKLLDLDQDFVCEEYHRYIVQSWIDRDEAEGIDVCMVDAGAADAIVQMAIFGALVYG